MITPEDIERGMQDFVSRYDFIKWLKVRYSVEHGHNDAFEVLLRADTGDRYCVYAPVPPLDDMLDEVLSMIEREFYICFDKHRLFNEFVRDAAGILSTTSSINDFDIVYKPDCIEIEHERTGVLIIKEETKAIDKKYIDYLNFISTMTACDYKHIVSSAIQILSLVVDGFLYDIKNKVFTHYGEEIEPNAAGWVVFGD